MLDHLRLAASVVALLGASLAPDAARRPPAQDAVVLVVDAEPVRRAHYEDWLLAVHGEGEAARYAELCALRARAAAAGVVPDRAAVHARALAEVEARLHAAHDGDRARFEAELAREGRTPAGRLAERTPAAERALLLEALAGAPPAVDEGALVAAFEERFGRGGRRPVVRLLRRRLVVPYRAGEDTAARRERTERLRAELRAEVAVLADEVRAGASFAVVAARESDHASGAQGGRPSDDAWRAWLPREALDALVDEPPGSLSPPLFARGAYWLLQLEAVEETALEDVRARLEDDLRAHARVAERPAPPPAAPVEVGPALLAPAGTSPDTVLFTVELPGGGSRVVRRAEYAAWLRRLHGEADARRFGLERALRREAAERELAPAPDLVDAGVAHARASLVARQYRGDERAWLAALERAGSSVDAWGRATRRRVELELLEDALARARRPADAVARERPVDATERAAVRRALATRARVRVELGALLAHEDGPHAAPDPGAR